MSEQMNEQGEIKPEIPLTPGELAIRTAVEAGDKYVLSDPDCLPIIPYVCTGINTVDGVAGHTALRHSGL